MWNYLIPASDTGSVALTYDMNILQSLDAPREFCVTLNHDDLIDASKILRRIACEHPVYTPRGVAASPDMRIFHLQDFGPDYARTLWLSRERFFERIDEVRQLGYPEPFVRLWEYYLCYREGGFT